MHLLQPAGFRVAEVARFGQGVEDTRAEAGDSGVAPGGHLRVAGMAAVEVVAPGGQRQVGFEGAVAGLEHEAEEVAQQPAVEHGSARQACVASAWEPSRMSGNRAGGRWASRRRISLARQRRVWGLLACKTLSRSTACCQACGEGSASITPASTRLSGSLSDPAVMLEV